MGEVEDDSLPRGERHLDGEAHLLQSAGFRVQGAGFRVQGSG